MFRNFLSIAARNSVRKRHTLFSPAENQRPLQPTREFSTQGPNPRQKKSSDRTFVFDSTAIGVCAATIGGALALLYIFKDFLGPRERKLLQPEIDLKANPHHVHIVDHGEFEYAGPKPAGELSGYLVKNKKTEKVYLLKGAASKQKLMEEFLVATFLAKQRPGEQPASHIIEKKLDDGSARLYTLSEIHPHSMDLLAFISNDDYKDKLAKKPLVGFEVALASDLLFAKQSDMKLSNYIVIETENAYVVASIDHELSGRGIQAKRILTNNLDQLAIHVRDIHSNPQSDNEDPKQFANAERADEFMHFAKGFMKQENVDAFYARVADFKRAEMMDIIRDVCSENGILTHKASDHFVQEMNGIIEATKQYCDEKKQKEQETTEKRFRR